MKRVGTGQQAWQESVFLDGTFQRPARGGTLPVRDKASGEIFGQAGLAGAADADTRCGSRTDTLVWAGVTAVLTADRRAGALVARRLRAGMVHVNDATPQDEALAPFGGMGASGLGGRSGGDANLEEFTQRRWLTVAPGPVHYPY